MPDDYFSGGYFPDGFWPDGFWPVVVIIPQQYFYTTFVNFFGYQSAFINTQSKHETVIEGKDYHPIKIRGRE